ncbi:flagellar biosynthetic protein FliO [Corallococcus sp. M34]|uniref:flagellar biosynthetic protein FliO n=1 Tax=Citreicoccus inhibens TaxID=2849499 RepID=UPI001C23245B|nr:flagellar biosynthetic protein FliO [Citreicoccus inhibens]MBU8894997.1 flagellar biosynthetic protein FliO [Citreicoccus inhibens]
MAVFRLFLSRLSIGAALVLAPSGVLAQAPAPGASAARPSVPTPVPTAVVDAGVGEAHAPASAPVASPAAVDGANSAAARQAELAQELGAGAPPGVSEEPESLAWTLVRTLAVLGAVVASIYLTLNVGLRRLMGLQGVPMGRPSVISVLERVPLDQRRTLFVVKAADEYLLVGGGGGESGLQLLSKLDREAVERIRAERPPSNVVSLSPFLQKLLSRRTGGSTPPGV